MPIEHKHYGTEYDRKSYVANRKTYNQIMDMKSFTDQWRYLMLRHSELLQSHGKTFPEMEHLGIDNHDGDPDPPPPNPVPPPYPFPNPNPVPVPIPIPPPNPVPPPGPSPNPWPNPFPNPVPPDQATYVINCWPLDCFCPDRETNVPYVCTLAPKKTIFYRMSGGMSTTSYTVPPDWTIDPHTVPQYVRIIAPIDACSESLIFKTYVFAPGEDNLGVDIHGGNTPLMDAHSVKWSTEWTIRACGNFMGSECCPKDWEISTTLPYVFTGTSVTLTAPYSMEWRLWGEGQINPKKGRVCVYSAPASISGCEESATIYASLCGTDCDSINIDIISSAPSGIAGYQDNSSSERICGAIWPLGICQATIPRLPFYCSGSVGSAGCNSRATIPAYTGYENCPSVCATLYAFLEGKQTAYVYGDTITGYEGDIWFTLCPDDTRTPEQKSQGCCINEYM